MRRLACAALVVSGLVLADGGGEILEARVGGGASSGSRGSRSYSAPRTPSAPVTPSTPRPAPPVAGPATPSPVPARPGGLFGGWGGMLGGFVLGGLLGSLLFGHGAGDGGAMGLGLLDLVLVAGLGVLLVSFLRRRAMERASPVGYAPASLAEPPDAPGGRPAGGSESAGPGDGGTSPGAVALADDLARGVAAIRTMDPSFDPGRFVGIATDLFTRLQIGWSGEDLAAVRAHLTDEMAVALEKDLARLHEKGRRNRVEDVVVESAEVTEAWQEYGRDLVTVHFRARAIDYTVDVATGQVLEGSRTVPVPFDEFWTFARPVGPNPWRLGAIQQPTAA